MKASEFRVKSTDELSKELTELLRTHFSLRMQVATQQNTKVSELGKIRNDIARVRTILGEKVRLS